jgi:flagellar motor switch protein FliN/FliY
MSNDTPMDPSAEQSMADDWAQALEEQTQSSGAGHGGAPAFDAMDDPFASVGKPAGSANDINMVLDIPVQLSVELGRTKVPIKYILQLGQGSVVELDALAGEPMDVLGQWLPDRPRRGGGGERQVWHSTDRHRDPLRAVEAIESQLMPSLVDAWPALALLAILACMPWLARRTRASGWQGPETT